MYRSNVKVLLKIEKHNDCILSDVACGDSENCPCWLSLGFGYRCIWDCQECFSENLFLHEVK